MNTPKKSREWTEAKVTDLLAARYKGTAWAFLPKVRNGTGWRRAARTADAIAMSLWPSRGLHIYGFEVKVERSDWLRELNDPQKAEDVFGFCDFWFVAAPQGVVNAAELPKTWGLLEIDGRGLRVTVDAPLLQPAPVDRLFLASLLRKVTENMAAESQLAEARKRGNAEGYEEGHRPGETRDRVRGRAARQGPWDRESVRGDYRTDVLGLEAHPGRSQCRSCRPTRGRQGRDRPTPEGEVGSSGVA
jgi:hypothetical protein